MFGRIQNNRNPKSALLAWLGLVLMIASFSWSRFSFEPTLPTPVAEEGAAQEPFAIIVIDPGHGGQDSGTIKGGILEKELTLDVAHRAERLLQERGLTPVLTRVDDSYVSLAGRAEIANKQSNCVFVSIHFDDAARPAAVGVETYYAAQKMTGANRIVALLPFLQKAAAEPTDLESQSLASFIQEALVAHTQAVNRGTRPQQFFVTANVRHPAVLVEGGFLTNKEEMTKLANGDYREQIAAAISDGVMHYREVLQHRETPLAVSLP